MAWPSERFLAFKDMNRSTAIVKQAFEHHLPDRLPRGELWLGTNLLKKANLEDNVKGHLALIKHLGQDILCLPLSNDLSTNKARGYRCFSLKELDEASKMSDLFVMALIEGPFQRLVGKKGLMNILVEWKRKMDEFEKEFNKERADVDALIKRCLELSVDAVILADDLAGEHSPFIDPNEIRGLFSSYYTQMVSEIHSGHSYALFHSCGNITLLIPQLVSCGFDGLAGIQHRTNDLISVKEKYGACLTLMAGIEGGILGAGEISLSELKEIKKLVKALAPGGGFILCSSSGLYSGDFLERIQEIYRITDEIQCSNRINPPIFE